MFSSISRRTAFAAQVAAGVVVLGGLGLAPTVAQASDTSTVSADLAPGVVSVSAPTITGLDNVQLDGGLLTPTTDVGPWSVTDASGSNDGYSVTVTAGTPTLTGYSGSGAAVIDEGLKFTATTASAGPGNDATAGPVSEGQVAIDASGETIVNGPAGSSQGTWDFPDGPSALEIDIPGDASAGSYSNTLTFTTGDPVAG